MRTTLIAACLLAATALQAQTKIELGQDKVLMHHGDNAEWKSPTLNESGWGTSNLVGNEITQRDIASTSICRNPSSTPPTSRRNWYSRWARWMTST